MNIDRDYNLILVFLGATGLVSIVAHCLIRRYLLASIAASFVAAFLTTVAAGVYMLYDHLPVAKLSWLGMIFVPAYIGAIPLVFLIGIPFFILTKWRMSRHPDEYNHIMELPNAGQLGLSAVLFLFLFYGISSVYHQMQQITLERMLSGAVEHGTVADVQNVLNMGADLDSRLGYGTTYLMYAAFYGNNETVAFLLKKGADPNAKGPKGETALKWATENKHEDTANLLRQAGAKE